MLEVSPCRKLKWINKSNFRAASGLRRVMVMASHDSAWQQTQQICLGLHNNNSVIWAPPFQCGNVCSCLSRCSGRQWHRKGLSVCENVTQNKARSSFSVSESNSIASAEEFWLLQTTTNNPPVGHQQLLKTHPLHWLLRHSFILINALGCNLGTGGGTSLGLTWLTYSDHGSLWALHLTHQ